jgi:hypothetical protein
MFLRHPTASSCSYSAMHVSHGMAYPTAPSATHTYQTKSLLFTSHWGDKKELSRLKCNQPLHKYDCDSVYDSLGVRYLIHHQFFGKHHVSVLVDGCNWCRTHNRTLKCNDPNNVPLLYVVEQVPVHRVRRSLPFQLEDDHSGVVAGSEEVQGWVGGNDPETVVLASERES